MTYLIVRMATLGNVAMTVPVIASLSRLYPQDEWIVVSQKPLGAMFYGMSNVHYHEVSKSIANRPFAIFRALSRYRFDAVFDLHGILTTRILCALFRLRRVPVYTIDLEQHAKRMLRFKGAKRAAAASTEFERYAATFRQAGLRTDDAFVSLPVHEPSAKRIDQLFGPKQGTWIGIAPFAKSKSNMLPYRITKAVIHTLSDRPNTRIFLFGAGKVECEMLRQWASIFDHTQSVAGTLDLSEELELMRRLDTMLCMDSANQHLASLVHLRALSVWCATHPSIGFRAWKQSPSDILERTDLLCRPCTSHGTQFCRFANYACQDIPVKTIVQTLLSTLPPSQPTQ